MINARVLHVLACLHVSECCVPRYSWDLKGFQKRNNVSQDAKQIAKHKRKSGCHSHQIQKADRLEEGREAPSLSSALSRMRFLKLDPVM